jgi:hypothetical protein
MFNKLKQAKEPTTDYVTLREMIGSRNWKIRAALAANPNLQTYLFDTLANDKSVKVRTALATNINLTLAIWKKLSSDTEPIVIQALNETHPTPPAKAGHRG